MDCAPVVANADPQAAFETIGCREQDVHFAACIQSLRNKPSANNVRTRCPKNDCGIMLMNA